MVDISDTRLHIRLLFTMREQETPIGVVHKIGVVTRLVSMRAVL